jgi:hypothetical protein
LRPDVAGASGLLRAHIGRRTDRNACDRGCGLVAAEQLAHPEIHHLDDHKTVGLLVQEHVLWLEIAVNDADRVSGDQGPQDVGGESGGDG